MELDDTDQGILYLLQCNARDITTREMGEQVGVSASTVRNRIEDMEEKGVIRGYHPDVDYAKAGLQLHVEITCSAPNPKREQLVEKALGVNGIISARELIDGRENIKFDAAVTDPGALALLADELTDKGLEVIRSKIIKKTHEQPFNHFGDQIVDGEKFE